jgi:diguanylate cyclase (GGDEF)-like protein
VVAVAFLATAGLIVRGEQLQTDARLRVQLGLRAQVLAHEVLVDVLDAETGQRGFMLTGRANYLEPYYLAVSRLRKSTELLATALIDEPAAAATLGALDETIAAKLAELDRTVRLKSEGQGNDAVTLVLDDSGAKAMSDIRELLRRLADEEGRRAEQRQTSDEGGIRNGNWVLAASLLFDAFLIAVLVLRMREKSVKARSFQRELVVRNDELSRLLDTEAAHNAQVRGLSELSRFLQSCIDMSEAERLLEQRLPLLVEAENGALYFMSTSRTQLRRAFSWGGGDYVEFFEPDDCWAVRLGQPFLQPELDGVSGCSHLQTENPRSRLNVYCLPLTAYGNLIGILVLDAGEGNGGHLIKLESEGYRRIALEQVGLAIGNLKLRESLRQQSIRDPLTGLYNRRFLEESAEREIIRAQRLEEGSHVGNVAMLMIDIDHFKQFNDEHGHEVGDQMLKGVAQLLQRLTRGSDVAARYGGEEFAVVLPDMPVALALERAELIRSEFEQVLLDGAASIVGPVSVSIGVAQFPLHGKTVEALIHSADIALYAAKRAGRNRVVFASSSTAVVALTES